MNTVSKHSKDAHKQAWGLLRRRTCGSHSSQRRAVLIKILAIAIVYSFLASSCTPQVAEPTETVAPEPIATDQIAGTQTPQPQAEHSIGIRNPGGLAEFYDKETGETFVVRGANYVFVPAGGSNQILRVGNYDPQRTRDDFAAMAALGYNTVRVFLDFCNQGPGCIGDADNDGLNPEYLDNIADMMLAAREAGIVILFTSNDLPDQGGYLFRLAYVGLGSDVRGIYQDNRLLLRGDNSPVNYSESLDTTYAGAFLSVGGEYNLLGYLGIGSSWGLRSLLSLRGGIYNASADYDGSFSARGRFGVSKLLT